MGTSSTSVLCAKHFHDEEAAYTWVEKCVWPRGPICPHCSCFERIGKLKGKSTRIGTYKCYDCRSPFSVKVGTIFEDSHIPLHVWLQAMFLLSSGKKGISSNQLHRTLGITLKSAWYLSHRIREAMRQGGLSPAGGKGGIVEVDETFIGNDRTIKPKGEKRGRGYAHKHKLLALVDRASGRARSLIVDELLAQSVLPILKASIDRETHIMTDEALHYNPLREHFTSHNAVNHGIGEYGRGVIHTNTIEGFFSIFKRGMKGVYQHCDKRHLDRYLAEFDFRYNERHVSDSERTDAAIRGVVGRRLMYRDSLAKGRGAKWQGV
jgi:transposase-like protein